jgi:hypothetical protein
MPPGMLGWQVLGRCLAMRSAQKRDRVDENDRIGLCASCRYMRRVESDRGSTFYFCEQSLTDSSFPKYPRLPVVQCRGYERRT